MVKAEFCKENSRGADTPEIEPNRTCQAHLYLCDFRVKVGDRHSSAEHLIRFGLLATAETVGLSGSRQG